MTVHLAKSAGFCFGVKRAVSIAEGETEKGAYLLGPVIHNDFVIADLLQRGLRLCHSVEEIPDKARVVIRSHGEAAAVYAQLRAKGCEIVDSTCPKVSKIHRIVERASEAGELVLIIGLESHPEVQAIAGHCRESLVFADDTELTNWLKSTSFDPAKSLCMVAQTTLSKIIWAPCREKLKKECTNAKIFDTICGATCERQSEALRLAEYCHAMVVIGDKKSSNTSRLAELCRVHCPKVAHISRAQDLASCGLRGLASVGITAGASTPGWIIKEVYDTMSEEIMEIEESFAEMLEKSIKTLNTGDKVSGIVTQITNSEINVDLGTKHAGYLPVSELTDDMDAKVEDLVKVGDEIEVFVMKVNDVDGVVTLSKKRLDSVKNWDNMEKAVEEATILEGVVTEENKGGVVVSVKGIRVFVPASQTGLPRGADLSQLVKTRARLRVTEVNRSRHRVVGSIRAVLSEERNAKAAEIWSAIEVGKRYAGTVKSLTSYGAFVDIGGVDGMVHVSELSWSRIKNPAEVVSVGDAVEVYVLSFEEGKKISLGMKDRTEDPWAKFIETFDVGAITDVRIVKLMTFGAFAEIVPGVDGLIHISQIADHRIEKPGDVLKEGQVVAAKITEIEYENKKISLSIRATLQQADADDYEEDVAADEAED